MAFRGVMEYNNGQTVGVAAGTGVIPGQVGDIVVLGGVYNSTLVTVAISDAGDAGPTNTGPNPWRKLNNPDPDIIGGNTNVTFWVKKLTANDVGKFVTLTLSSGGWRFPMLSASFSGRGPASSVTVSRSQEIDANATFESSTINANQGDDIAIFYFARSALATAPSLVTPEPNQTKRGETLTAMASPNYSVTVASRNNSPTGPNGGGVNTFNQVLTHAISYSVSIPSGAANIPPEAIAGANQSAIEPYSTVTLSGTDSDADGTITARAWTQTAGTPVVALAGTGATRTFKAPGTINGTTLTFQYSVTDNEGATGSDTLTVQVDPVTERAAVGEVLVPLEIRAVVP
jgi:hypothetical protein